MNVPHLESLDSVKGSWKKGLLPMHLLFLAMALTFILLGSLLQHWNFKIGILATEFGMLVLPAVIFMKVRKLSIREQFKFTKPRTMDLVKVVVAGLCFVPMVGLANSLINLWFVYGLNITPPQIPIEEGTLGPLVTFLIAAVTPGFCEEFFFRGMILTEYEKRMGSFQAAFITALLFGLFHYNIMNLLGPILLGLIFAWVMQVTGSIFTAMLGHMVNNTFAVVMLYATANVDQTKNMEAMAAFADYWPLVVLLTIFMLLLITLPLAFIGVSLLKSLRKGHLKPQDILAIGTRQFEVIDVFSENLTLVELTRESADFGEGAIETTYEKLHQNRGLRLVNRHWKLTAFDYPLHLKEWWSVLLAVVVYIGLNILTIMHMINQ